MKHLDACENMMNQSIQDSILTNKNIDDLFAQADELESIAQQDEEQYEKL